MEPKRRKVRQLAAVVLAGLVIAVALFVGAQSGLFRRQDLRVHVANVGDMELQSVTIQVVDHAYELGTIMPGKSASTVVAPASKSGVKLVVKNLQGDSYQFDVEGDVEPKVVGDIRVAVTGDRVVQVERQIAP